MSGIVGQYGIGQRSGIIGPAASNQPAFLARSGGQSTPANDDTITFGTVVFDQTGNFSSNTFTAPVSGRYQFQYYIIFYTVDNANTHLRTNLKTTNREFSGPKFSPDDFFNNDNVYWSVSFSMLTDMDANDTAYCTYNFTGGSTVNEIQSDSAFSGYLAC